jgi:hypothetical protein
MPTKILSVLAGIHDFALPMSPSLILLKQCTPVPKFMPIPSPLLLQTVEPEANGTAPAA